MVYRGSSMFLVSVFSWWLLLFVVVVVAKKAMDSDNLVANDSDLAVGDSLLV